MNKFQNELNILMSIHMDDLQSIHKIAAVLGGNYFHCLVKLGALIHAEGNVTEEEVKKQTELLLDDYRDRVLNSFQELFRMECKALKNVVKENHDGS